MAESAKTRTHVPAPTEAEIAHDKELSDEELLADMPELKAPEKLRIRERNRIMRLVFESDFMDKDDEKDAPKPKTAAEKAEAAKQKKQETLAILDLVAGIDEFAESIATDKEAYAEWSEGQDYPAFLALMHRYSAALGK